MLAAQAIDVCAEYDVALAVEDFVPCVLALAALIVLARAVRIRVPRAYRVALLGGLVISAGGFGKATWKLLVATGCWEYPWLEALLFPCLSFGFAAVAWAVLSAVKGREVKPLWFVLFPLAAGVGSAWMSISAGEYQNWPLLIGAAVGATFLGITLAVTAFKAGKPSVGALFVFYTLGTNVLPPLAAQPNQSAELQWAEQLTNSAVQLCFLLGALWLREHLTTKAAHAGLAAAEKQTGVTA
ncbi:hypothetical protein [Nocardioides pantholopis]|uniref:hypothetical protein n=1 Tax=Nocardioides pantholopis TaxID=2483798 RepID=UPI000F07BA6D|nr:hypothetical protein [Nocardioides pantholopis]